MSPELAEAVFGTRGGVFHRPHHRIRALRLAGRATSRPRLEPPRPRHRLRPVARGLSPLSGLCPARR